MQVSWRTVLPMALLGVLIAGIAIADRTGLPGQFDPSAPFAAGDRWGMVEAVAEHGGSVTVTGGVHGYDGQWFLGLAYDPFLRSDITSTFDRPQYRAQRPLLSILGWLVVAGQPAAIPIGLLVVQILAVGLGCAACARIVTAFGRSRWWGMTYAVIPGVAVGALFGTAEALGCALAALGLSVVLDRRYLWAGLAFAGAGLTKETYLAFVAGAAVFVAFDAIARGVTWVWDAVAIIVPGILTFGAWWLYVSATTLASQRTPNRVFTFPFHGWWETFVVIGRGEYRVDYHDYPLGAIGGGAVMIGTFVITVVALVAALWFRQSVLAYCAAGWGLHGLIVVDVLLGRFLSAQRTLAPTLLAAFLLLTTIPWTRRPAAAERPVDAIPAQRVPAPDETSDVALTPGS